MPDIEESARWIALTFSGDGVISALSSEAEQLTGFTARELVGRSITEILADDSVFRLPDVLGSATECGTWSGEILHRHRSGVTLPAYAVFTRLTSPDVVKPGFLLTSAFSGAGSGPMKDARFREIGGRIRDFAHQFNNPLAVLLGFSQLIMVSPQCVGKIRADMDKIYSEMKRLVDVVQRLHQYGVALQDSSHPQPTLQR